MQYFDKVVYTFSADNEPTGTIDSGEIVIFRTQDCFSNQMHSESQLVTSCDYSKMNPATGPLFVRDAQPGDVIKVELLDVQCDTIGTTTTLPKIGPLWDKCETRTKRIPIENGKAVKKEKPQPPKRLVNIVRCKNPRCISSIEEECDQIFELSSNGKYRCIYCEQELQVKPE